MVLYSAAVTVLGPMISGSRVILCFNFNAYTRGNEKLVSNEKLALSEFYI